MIEGLLNPANYAVRNATLLLPLLSIAIVLHHAWLLHKTGLKSAHIKLALLGFAILLWLIPEFFLLNSLREDLAIWWAKASYLGVPFIPSALYHFTVTICDRYSENRMRVWIGWAASVFFSALFTQTNLMISGVLQHSWGFFTVFSPLVIPYLLFFWFYQWLSLREIWRDWNRIKPDSTQHRRVRAFFFAFAIGSFGNIDYLAALGVPVYPMGTLAVGPAFLIIVWTILKYRLIDITPSFAAESIIGTMKESLIVLDEGGIIRLVNNATIDLLGHMADDLKGHDFFEFFPAETFRNIFNPESSGGTVRNVELPYFHPDGQELILDISVALMIEHYFPIARILILRNVTQDKLATRAMHLAYEEMELRVRQRTAELTEANKLLSNEVTNTIALREQLEKLSITDALTGFYNLRGFLTLAKPKLKLSLRKMETMLLIYADMDNLKVINDESGHQEGDKALTEIANILKRTFRETDILARLGGDEFAILAIDTCDKKVVQERIQKNIDSYNKKVNPVHKLSLSVGIVCYDPEKPCTLDNLLSKADALMYDNKLNKKR